MPVRCSWCAWPDVQHPGDPRLEPISFEVEGMGRRDFCDPSCAIAFGRAVNRPDIVHRMRAHLRLPPLEEVQEAPMPHLYDWWHSPGGLSRSMWIATCVRPASPSSEERASSPLRSSGKLRALRSTPTK